MSVLLVFRRNSDRTGRFGGHKGRLTAVATLIWCIVGRHAAPHERVATVLLVALPVHVWRWHAVSPQQRTSETTTCPTAHLTTQIDGRVEDVAHAASFSNRAAFCMELSLVHK